MENFEFRIPTDFVFGKGVESRVGEKLRAAGATKVLVHFGGGSAERSGLLDRVRASLNAAAIPFIEVGGVRANPEISLVRTTIAAVRENDVDFLLAVGGGSVIDSAKAVAVGACYDGDEWDFHSKKATPQAALPIATILTIPAAGSEASNSCVISNDEQGLKSGMTTDLVRPLITFMNPELTYTLPPYQTAAGAVDMFCHILERWFNGGPSVAVTDNIALSLMRTIRAAAPRVLVDPCDYEARADLMWAGMLAHNGLCGLGYSSGLAAPGRTGDWASHGIEHELSAIDPSITHGAGLAVIFPAWLRHVYTNDPMRLVKLGREVFGISDSGDAVADSHRTIEALQMFFISLDMPSTLGQLGITEDHIEQMIPTLIANKGEEFGAFYRLTADDARAIYRSAL